MEEKNLEVIEMEPEMEMVDDNSSAVAGLIGLGLGVVGTIVISKVSKKAKAWIKKKVMEEDDVIDADFVEVPEEETKSEDSDNKES